MRITRGTTCSNLASEDLSPQAGDHPAGDLSLSAAGHSGFTNRLRSDLLASWQQPGHRGVCRALGPDLSAVCRAYICVAAESAQAFCRAAPGRAGFEVSHAHGRWRAAAFVIAGDGDVLVCLRIDE